MDADLDQSGAAERVNLAYNLPDLALEVGSRAVQCDLPGLTDREFREQTHWNWGFKLHVGGVVDGQENLTGIGEVAGLNAPISDDAIHWRDDLRVRQHD